MREIRYWSIKELAEDKVYADVSGWGFTLVAVSNVFLLFFLTAPLGEISYSTPILVVSSTIIMATLLFFLIKKLLLKQYKNESNFKAVELNNSCTDKDKIELINKYSEEYPEVKNHIRKRLNECDNILNHDISAIKTWIAWREKDLAISKLKTLVFS